MLNKVRVWFGQVATLRFAGYLVLLILVFFLFFWHMSSYTKGLAPAENSARLNSLALHNIYNNPVNAPYKLLQYVLLKISPDSLVSLRLVPALMACVFGFCFYKLSSCWFGKLIGGFGTLIFISLPLFVISARQASGEIMLFSTVVLLWLYAWFNKTPNSKSLAWLTLAASAGLLLYTPGIVWFVLISLFICRKKLLALIGELSNLVKISGLMLVFLIILPLVVSGVSHPNAIRQLFLIPGSWLPVTAVLKNIAWGVSAIFFKAPVHPLIIANLPIINLVALALAIFGIYALQAAARVKAMWLSLSIILAVLAAGLNNNIIFLSLGLPAIALLVSGGLRYLYIEWRTIFPRNPVPKTFALILIAGVVVSQVYYGIRYSLVAWPHTSATRSVYVIK